MDPGVAPQSNYSSVPYNHLTIKGGTLTAAKLKKARGGILNSIFGSNKVRAVVGDACFWLWFTT